MDDVLAACVLVSCALVLIAPVLGRSGWAHAADLCMGLAASGGLLSFGLAAVGTIRATRDRALRRAGKERT